MLALVVKKENLCKSIFFMLFTIEKRLTVQTRSLILCYMDIFYNYDGLIFFFLADFFIGFLRFFEPSPGDCILDSSISSDFGGSRG